MKTKNKYVNIKIVFDTKYLLIRYFFYFTGKKISNCLRKLTWKLCNNRNVTIPQHSLKKTGSNDSSTLFSHNIPIDFSCKFINKSKLTICKFAASICVRVNFNARVLRSRRSNRGL